mgnify:FL=1
MTEKSFWTEHMKVARDYNTTVKPGTDLGKTLLDEISRLEVCDLLLIIIAYQLRI